jgi:hypothetical protein
MRTYKTANEIRSELEAAWRNVTGRAGFTADEADIVNNAIIDSYQLCLDEYGVGNFKFHKTEIDVDTTSGQAYVDLDQYVYRVLPGTVRIPAEDTILTLSDEAAIIATDPEWTEIGVPEQYTYQASSDPDTMRLGLWPVPNGTYTIKAWCLKYPSDAITNFPSYLVVAIKNKAKELACIALPMQQLAPGFKSIYEEAIMKVKNGYAEAPMHIGRSKFVRVGRSIESRIRQ